MHFNEKEIGSARVMDAIFFHDLARKKGVSIWDRRKYVSIAESLFCDVKEDDWKKLRTPQSIKHLKILNIKIQNRLTQNDVLMAFSEIIEEELKASEINLKRLNKVNSAKRNLLKLFGPNQEIRKHE